MGGGLDPSLLRGVGCWLLGARRLLLVLALSRERGHPEAPLLTTGLRLIEASLQWRTKITRQTNQTKGG